MSKKTAIRAQWETVRTLAFGSISGTFMGVGTVFDNPARNLIIQNFTDVTLDFSDDGVDTKFKLIPNSLFVWDITTNKSNETGFFIPEGARIYVKRVGSAATEGEVSVSVSYGSID
ncbi:MAG: hypothetical protein V3T88_04225 [Nitrosomonadaceae bacterium]